MIKAHGFISGLVQGVSFRSWTQRTAQLLALSGWVKNLFDGRVEVIFVGKKEEVEKMTEFLYQGPPLASIEKVEVVEKKEIQSDPFGGKFTING